MGDTEGRVRTYRGPDYEFADALTAQQYLDDVLLTVSSSVSRLLPAMTDFAGELRARCGSSGVALLAGNGGASALLTHFASEVMMPTPTSGFVPLRCIDLTGNSPLFSAATNDLGAQDGVAFVVRAVASDRDSLIVASTSGVSVNLIRAAQAARDSGTPVLSLVGQKGSALETESDLSWVAGSPHAEVAQDAFSIALHLLSLLLKQDNL